MTTMALRPRSHVADPATARRRLVREPDAIVDDAQVNAVADGPECDCDTPGPGMSGHVRQRLAQCCEEVIDLPVADGAIHGSLEGHGWVKAQQASRLARELEHPSTNGGSSRARRLDIEDHSSDVANCHVELGDSRVHTAPRVGVVDQARGTLQRQTHGEEALYDGVVQVATDPLLVLEEREPLQVLTTALVLEHHAG